MLDDEIDEFYAQGDEDGRLFQDGRGRLEFVRTLELLERVLPAAPARVLDIGGGTGVYARALADRGYAVDLVDPVETHVNRAVEVINDCGFHNSVTASVGDARSVAFATDAFDAVLMLGPLYHLTLSTDRVTAWSEAFRVARPGAVVVAVGISRYSSLLDGLKRQVLIDSDFRQVVEADLVDGQHRNPLGSRRAEFFTTAYFHTPDELIKEAATAGLESVQLLAVEGPAWLMENVHEIDSHLYAARAVEAAPSLWGASMHLLVVGTTPPAQ